MDAEDIIEGDAKADHDARPGNQPAWEDMPEAYKESGRVTARGRYGDVVPPGL